MVKNARVSGGLPIDRDSLEVISKLEEMMIEANLDIDGIYLHSPTIRRICFPPADHSFFDYDLETSLPATTMPMPIIDQTEIRQYLRSHHTISSILRRIPLRITNGSPSKFLSAILAYRFILNLYALAPELSPGSGPMTPCKARAILGIPVDPVSTESLVRDQQTALELIPRKAKAVLGIPTVPRPPQSIANDQQQELHEKILDLQSALRTQVYLLIDGSGNVNSADYAIESLVSEALTEINRLAEVWPSLFSLRSDLAQ